MDKSSYKHMLEAARHDLERALEEREQVEKRISGLKQTIIALSRLTGEEDALPSYFGPMLEDLGITDQCKEVIRTAGRPMTPVEIRDQLVRMGLKADKYRNLMASVHRVLKRLAESGKVVKTTTADGEAAYELPIRFPRFPFQSKARRRAFSGGKEYGASDSLANTVLRENK